MKRYSDRGITVDYVMFSEFWLPAW